MIMKRIFLLPNYFKRIGALLFLPFAVICILMLFGIGDDDSIKLPVMNLLEPLSSQDVWYHFHMSGGLVEIAMSGLLISLCFIALSREKDEDEMTAQIRMNSFVWSLWAMAILMTIGIFFTFGLDFLNYALIEPFAFFILYIIRFNLTMFRIRRDSTGHKTEDNR